MNVIIPNSFGTRSGDVAASELDANFQALAAAINHIPMRVVTAAGAVTVTTTDSLIVVKKTVGAATVVNLPGSPTAGDAYTIKDGAGDADTHNITLTPAAGTIDGQSTFVIATPWMAVRAVYNGTEWSLL